MKKIITFIIVLIIVIIGYKVVTNRNITDNVIETMDEQIAENKKASIGSTIVCPICHKEFKKKLFSNYDFDKDECREKYHTIVSNLEKVNDFTDKAASVVEDTKKSIEKNF